MKKSVHIVFEVQIWNEQFIFTNRLIILPIVWCPDFLLIYFFYSKINNFSFRYAAAHQYYSISIRFLNIEKKKQNTIVNLWTWIAFSVSEDPCKTKIETIWLDVGMLRGEIVLNQMILTCFISTIFIFNVNNSKRQSIFY